MVWEHFFKKVKKSLKKVLDIVEELVLNGRSFQL